MVFLTKKSKKEINPIPGGKLFGNPKPSDGADPFSNYQKTRKIYVWKGTVYFPYVSIEEFNNQDFSKMLITVTENAKLGFENFNVQFTRLG